MPASKDALASHADVLRGFVTRSCPTSEAGTRDEPLRTSAWEARDAPLAPAYRRALFFTPWMGNRSLRYKVLSIRTQEVKLHKNFVHFKYRLKNKSVSRSRNLCQIQIGIPACVMSCEYFTRTSLYLVRLNIFEWIKFVRKHLIYIKFREVELVEIS